MIHLKAEVTDSDKGCLEHKTQMLSSWLQ